MVRRYSKYRKPQKMIRQWFLFLCRHFELKAIFEWPINVNYLGIKEDRIIIT